MRRLMIAGLAGVLVTLGLGVAEAAPAELKPVSGGVASLSLATLQTTFTPDKIAEVIRTAKPIATPEKARSAKLAKPERPGPARVVAEPQAPNLQVNAVPVANAVGRTTILCGSDARTKTQLATPSPM
jgi:hypothetical protein